MAGGFNQYLKDTRAELRHVAWPTRMQTIVYSILVAGISVGVAIYLGLFDFLFTSALSHVLNTLPANSQPAAAQQSGTPAVTVTQIATGTLPLHTK